MSKIKFCALGGLGENGKNMYLLEIDDKIFVLDAGLKFPSVDLYGVDTVVYGHLHGKIPNAKEVITLNNINYFLTSCDMIKNQLVRIY